jgi:hypothetical protein
MSVVGSGSAMATVEEATTVAAEEVDKADDGPLDATPSLMMTFEGGVGVMVLRLV